MLRHRVVIYPDIQYRLQQNTGGLPTSPRWLTLFPDGPERKKRYLLPRAERQGETAVTLSGTLKAISKELIRNNIQFCITGGFAYSVYAEPDDRRYRHCHADSPNTENTLSREDLIILKSASSREQDLLDARKLMRKADTGYLETWAGRLGIEIYSTE